MLSGQARVSFKKKPMAYNVASLIGTAIALPLLGVIAVILRFYVRLRLRPTFIGIDDWLIVLAVVLVVGQCANQVVAAVIGMLGRDNEPVVDWRVAHESKIDYATLVIEKVTYSAMKLSVLFFYRRIFYQQRGFRIANYILIVLISLWGIAFLFAEIFLCGANSHHGHPCAPQEWTSLWFAITEVIGDIAILSLPYPCIRKLQMSGRDKIGLSAIFFLGALTREEDVIQEEGLVDEKARSEKTMDEVGVETAAKSDGEFNPRPMDLLGAPAIERGSVGFPYDRFL
ncbi:uncharacterized protein KY384_003836 [Bacidia gigantensis]|uniref:uncharacterized protein n=1 Tax=Bacidia gigantensis TaxID=2732470 RepID=UPI001D037354|nr:uncharacterized protein KY384_003836 [Bacidia gigantensis]KAG8532195.1 hypothetical protein KY384_003836 [Bacidia gigantensis]